MSEVEECLGGDAAASIAATVIVVVIVVVVVGIQQCDSATVRVNIAQMTTLASFVRGEEGRASTEHDCNEHQ